MTRLTRCSAWVCSIGLFYLGAAPSPTGAQIRVHPTGVNVNTQGATTAFLTFGGLGDYEPIEAAWCGALVTAAPSIGLRCDPARMFGLLPLRLDRSRLTAGAFTDIMSIPPSVGRRAYQAAAGGEQSDFFYVRRFRSRTAGRPDQYVAVTCRLAGGGARTPLALVDVALAFAGGAFVPLVRQGSAPPELAANVTYTGTGRLTGRWEVVVPGDDLPTERDLLPEASLPLEERPSQRRYTPVGRFSLFLPPNGRVHVPGPDASRLPTAVDGPYYVLLRIEAVTDKEADSDRGAAGAGSGVVAAGAVAGFPLPVLRYVVGSGDGEQPLPEEDRIALLTPSVASVVTAGVTFSWREEPGVAEYRLELRGPNDEALLSALTPGAVPAYRTPPWFAPAVSGPARWRVVALDVRGRAIARSTWREVRLTGR
jgi:hypothetical protein